MDKNNAKKFKKNTQKSGEMKKGEVKSDCGSLEVKFYSKTLLKLGRKVMKKLALIVGSLLLAANASAKEVVAAPVVVEEPVVVEAAPLLPAFKPSGFVSIEQKYNGHGEHDSVPQNYFRTEFKGAVQMTEADQLQWRIRSYDDLNSSDSDIARARGAVPENTETRYRWLHSLGLLGDTAIKMATRFELRQRDDYDKYEGQLRFNFVDYIPDYSWLDTKDFTLSPKVRYVQYGESDDSAVGGGIDFQHAAVLPWGFESDLTVYYTYNDNSGDHYRNSSQYPKPFNPLLGDDEDTNSSNNIDVEYYLYWSHMMWESQDRFYQLNAYLENGIDALSYRDGDGDTNNNSIYTMPEAQFIMNLNPATRLLLGAGAEYRNWGARNDEMSSMQNWTWVPFVRALIKTVF